MLRHLHTKFTGEVNYQYKSAYKCRMLELYQQKIHVNRILHPTAKHFICFNVNFYYLFVISSPVLDVVV